MGLLSGKPVGPPKDKAAPKDKKAAAPEPQQMQMAVPSSGSDGEIYGHSAAAIKARLERKVDDMRWDDNSFHDLGVSAAAHDPLSGSRASCRLTTAACRCG